MDYVYHLFIGLLAVIFHLIFYQDCYVLHDGRKEIKNYKNYIAAIFVYFLSDSVWFYFYEIKSIPLLYADTVIYYIFMALSVTFFCRYVISFLRMDNLTGKILDKFGVTFAFSVVAALIINYFHPIFFRFADDGTYVALPIRHAVIVVQVVTFGFISLLTLWTAMRTQGSMRKRNRTISLFGFTIVAALIAQFLFPLMPLYSMGLMVSSLMNYVLIHNEEQHRQLDMIDQMNTELKEDHRKLQEQKNEIDTALCIINALTPDYHTVWLVDKETFHLKLVRQPGKETNMQAVEIVYHDLPISELIKQYIEHFVVSADRERMSRLISRETILEKLSQSDYFAVNYKRIREDGGEDYNQMVFSNVDTPDGRHQMVLAFRDVTQVIQQEQELHKVINEAKEKEIRFNQIMKTFAQTYLFFNYVDLENDTFSTYTEKEINDEALLKAQTAGSATASIRIGLEEIVCDEHRAAMTAFTDLTTINDRMSNSNLLVSEYQDKNGVWFEFTFAVTERKEDGSIRFMLWAIRLIDNEKQIELRRQKVLEENIAANKAKSKFLQNMSHEIRTPLNALFGFAQLLGMPEGYNTEEEREQYNAYIYNSYQMLEMLISDILDIADSEHGNYRIDITDVCVNDVCRNALRSVEFRVPASVNAHFTTEIPDDYATRTDARRVQQVLINFLTNACKNTQEGEIHVHCSVSEHPGKITLSVADTGPGVPKEKADSIFERFTKLNQFKQGSGLGLNICSIIADKLGGKVYLDTNYTNGARFVFMIDDTQA